MRASVRERYAVRDFVSAVFETVSRGGRGEASQTSRKQLFESPNETDTLCTRSPPRHIESGLDLGHNVNDVDNYGGSR